ncbi:Uncharacterised protein [Mycobacteroides abscessus subsp. abscessus]|nr:Uncharacterised protein [Mycobacteroides abscessus subsp. abscessus]
MKHIKHGRLLLFDLDGDQFIFKLAHSELFPGDLPFFCKAVILRRFIFLILLAASAAKQHFQRIFVGSSFFA